MRSSLRRFKKALLADKKRLSLMLILTFVGLLMWGRLLLKEVPRSAVADPSASALSDKNPSAAESAKITRRPVVEVDLFGPDSDRDLFALNPDLFERVKQPEKVPEQNLVPKKSEEQIKAELAQRLDGLKLQSVLVIGGVPHAMINNQLYSVGQPIQTLNDFVIEQITQTSAMLKHKNGMTFPLKMYRE